ncbi:MAG: sigma-70 family RNA polymerase sigma factor [Thermomicrobiaceae bacterium]
MNTLDVTTRPADLIVAISGPSATPGKTAPSWDDEAELIARAQQDSREFGPLYERYVDRIYRYTYRRIGDHEAAEDLTAQTFQQALAALPGYEWRGVPFSAWLYRIAGNLVIRYRRVSGREVTMEHVDRIVDEHYAMDDPLDSILGQSSRDQLYVAMQRLSPDQRRALVLKYSHGMKNGEVGELMNRTEGGVKQLVHRAMVILRRTLAELDAERDTGTGKRPVSVGVTAGAPDQDTLLILCR